MLPSIKIDWKLSQKVLTAGENLAGGSTPLWFIT